MNALFKPIKEIFLKIWDSVLVPVLEFAFKSIGKIILSMIQEILSSVFYQISMVILKLIECFELVVRYLLGVNLEIVDGKRVSLLENIFSMSAINKIMWVFVLLSFLLTFVFAFRRLFSIVSADENEQKPFSAMFREMLKCWYRLGITFFYCLLFLKVVSIGVLTITYSTQSYTSSIANMVFVVSALDESKRDKNTIIDQYIDSSDKTHWYSNESQVKRDFNYKKINYLALLLLSVTVFLVFLSLTFKLSRRIFNLVILYLIGPFFAVMSLLKDEDKQYEKWQSMFIANFMNVLFPVVGFFLFSFIATNILKSNVVFYTGKGGGIINSVMTVLFLACLLNAIPKSMSFGYNLLTDQGRFLSNEDFTLRDLSPLNLFS